MFEECLCFVFFAGFKQDSPGFLGVPRGCPRHKGTSTSGTLHVYVTDHIFLADTIINSWVFDTGSVAHICISTQGMIRSRSIERGEVDFRVGNNARVAALTVGTMQLHLPSRFIMELNNCYFVPSLSRNILSPS
jgi:hypothetical protein